jgi:hypothetical protein
MTHEEYRQHVTGYATHCAACSFIQYYDSDYLALSAAGDEIIPWLVKDLANAYSDKRIFRVSVHMVMSILASKATDRPVIPEDKRGKVEYIRQAWIKWGADHGYDTTQDEPLSSCVHVPLTERKWNFWIANWALCWGDRSTKKAHTQIGFAIVFLLGWGVYWLLRHL